MTKQTFNIGKWFTIIWLAIGLIGNAEYMFESSDSFWAVIIAGISLVWLFNLKLTIEEKENIEIKVV